jgi:hypothetical protein
MHVKAEWKVEEENADPINEMRGRHDHYFNPPNSKI